MLNRIIKFPSRRSIAYLLIPKPSCSLRSVSSFAPTPSREAPLFGRSIHSDANRAHFGRSLRFATLRRPKSSSALQHCDESGDGENEVGRNGIGNDNDYSVDIEENGKAISITIPAEGKTIDDAAIVDNNNNDDDVTGPSATTSNSWKFSSALLWVNDPNYIHASSGQRIRTLGQYSRNFAITSARIICAPGENGDCDSNNSIHSHSSLQNLHPAPPQGSLHSRGGIYYNTIESRSSHDRTVVKLTWNYGEESFFDLDWLIDHARNNCLGQCVSSTNTIDNDIGDMARGSSRKGLVGRATMTTTEVTKEIAIGSRNNPNAVSIAKFDYNEILQNEDYLFEGMQEIFEHGAILVQNAPDVEDGETSDETSSTTLLESVVGNLGKRFSGGSLSHGSLYGDVFHVRSKNNAENIAYTNEALPPHQDLTYYESKPFLQLLHCATNTGDNSDGTPDSERVNTGDDPTRMNGIVGGESTLIDGMAVAEELRQLAPDLFHVLCRTEAVFVKERHDSDMVSPKPHIVVDPAYGQVVEFNWSPPFEGPLQIHPEVVVEDYVRAYQAIECMIDNNLTGSHNGDSDGCYSTLLPESFETLLRDYAKQYTWEYTMQKGDVLVFNNQRMLHGRRSFRSFGSTKRHLLGCYTDAMDTVSRYRQLLRQRKEKSGGGHGKRNPGSGCRWV